MSNEKKREYLKRIRLIASKGLFEGCLTQVQSKKLGLIILLNVLMYVVLFSIFLIDGFLKGWGEMSISGFMVIGAIFAMELLIFLILLLVFFHQRKKVIKWLEDAKECEGYTEVLDIKNRFGLNSIKLKINFIVEGEKYERITGDSSNLGDYDAINGYYSGIEEFANKQVKVLYSPTYDEVMILNN